MALAAVTTKHGVFLSDADIAKERSLPREYEMFSSSSVQTIAGEAFATARSYYENDPLIRAAATMLINETFGCRMGILEGGKALHPSIDSLWVSTLTKFGKALMADIFTYGWVAFTIVPHPVLEKIPKVINLHDGITVRTRQNLISEPVFGFYRSGMGGNGSLFLSDAHSMPVPGIFTFAPRPPNSRGELCSVVTSLIPAIRSHMHLRSLQIRACSLAANPAVITERQVKPFQQFPSQLLNKELGGGPGNRYDPVVPALNKETADYIDKMVRASGSLGTTNHGMLYSEVKTMLEMKRGHATGNHIRLDDDRKLVHQMAPLPPPDMIEHELQLQKIIFLAFNIPPSMILPEHAQGKGVIDATSQGIWDGTIRALRQMVTEYLTDTWDIMFGKANMERFLFSAAPALATRREDMIKATKTTITITGMPSATVIRELDREGAAEWPAYREHMMKLYDLPEDFIPKERKISLLDVLTQGKDSMSKRDDSTTRKVADQSSETTLATAKMAAAAKVAAKPKKKAKKKK